MTNPQTFEGARLKVERANRHIREYTETIIAFLQTDFCELTVEEDGDTGHYFIKVDATTRYPPMLPAIIGDVVHNLRTALDYIIVEFTGLDLDWISLPIGKDRTDVEVGRVYKAIRGKLPSFASFLLDEIQPYAGGKFKVWELAKLDNVDKHKLLIPVTTISTLHRVDIEDERGNRIAGPFVAVEAGRAQLVGKGLGKVKINNKGQAGINVRFGEETPFPGQTVLDVLSDLPKVTLQAIEAFELFCFGQIANPHAGKI